MRSLLLLTLLLSIAAGVPQALAGSHPHPHPSVSPLQQCLASLSAYKAEGRHFCRKYLNGRHPSRASTVTLPASTTTTTVTPLSTTTSTATTSTTLADVQTTTTTTSTQVISTTSTTRQQRRRGVQTAAAIAALQERSSSHRPSQLPKYYSADVVTEACLLFLYGKAQDDAATIQLPLSTVTVQAPASISTDILTSVITVAPTSTKVSTSTTITTTTTTSVSIIPRPSIAAAGFEECPANVQGPVAATAACPWTFSQSAYVSNRQFVARSGSHAGALEVASASSMGSATISQIVTSLVPNKLYTVSGYYRGDAFAGATTCTFQLAVQQTASGNTLATETVTITYRNYSPNYQPISVSFATGDTTANVVLQLQCTSPNADTFDDEILVDDLSINPA